MISHLATQDPFGPGHDLIDSREIDTALKRRFGRARGHIADSRPSTLLEIRDRRTYVAGGTGDTPEFYEALYIGARSLTEAYLPNSPPSAMDPERAINEIEDQVMRVLKSAPINTVLITTDVCDRSWRRPSPLKQAQQLCHSMPFVCCE